MSATMDRLILWVGEKHSGKTTVLARFVEIARAENLKVAGILAPSLYRAGELTGFDVLDLRDGNRAPLARREIGADSIGQFTFLEDGWKLGKAALSKEATESADLVVVDEFGPLELSGRGWRCSVDSLLTSSNQTVILVVRRKLVNSVRRTYYDFQCRQVDADEPGASHKVIEMLTRSIHG